MTIVARRVPWHQGRQHTPIYSDREVSRWGQTQVLNHNLSQLDTSLEYFADEQNGSVLRLFI